MADYTAITDMTMVQCIATGMNNGDNLSIDDGATVTCKETPSILLGQIDIDNGKLLIDGVNITSGKMINFVGEQDEEINVYGEGAFEVNGAWVNVGTTTGVGSQVGDISATGFDYWNSTLEDAIPMIQIETGRRIYYSGSSGTLPEVDDFIRKTSNKSVLGRIVEVNTTLNYIVVRYLHM